MPNYLTHLECSDLGCGRTYSAQEEQHLCSCGAPLLARYDLDGLAREVSRNEVAARPWRDGLWRYAELLPEVEASNRVSLGEGLTPLLPVGWLGVELDLRVWVKDESLNPTGTFKARGAALGVSMARALGVRTIALPTAGNAGAAWAAYGARAGLEVVVAMPQDAPELTKQEVRLYGARLHLVDGLISDAGRWIADGIRAEGWYDAGTFREPYRLEGKKTLGLEIAEQMGWQPPDVILYPTGGGVGLLGLWKAFGELSALGWLNSGLRTEDLGLSSNHHRSTESTVLSPQHSLGPLPRLVVVQSSGCAPVVRAWQGGADSVAFWEGASTVAAGLRVPGPLAGSLMLRALRETEGTAVAVDDESILQASEELARAGLWVCPEGAALLPALRRLREEGWIRAGERVVLLNTGTGLVYPDVMRDA